MVDVNLKKEFKTAVDGLAKGLEEADVDQLISMTQRIEIPSGRVLIKDQQPVEQIYIVIKGKLDAVLEDSQGKSIVVGSIGAGDLIGEVSLLSGSMIASSSVVTASDVVVLKMTHTAFSSLMNEGSHLARSLLEYVVSRLCIRLKSSRARVVDQMRGAEKLTSNVILSESKQSSFLSRLLGLR